MRNFLGKKMAFIDIFRNNKILYVLLLSTIATENFEKYKILLENFAFENIHRRAQSINL